ncbi:tetratricopeptide repeat protein [Leptospira jelokensis]|uniref:tetratricopeptide repeat protein n=1 Tax=Leptospira jelokensis TaxID=2484931 RepID=UPI001AF01330|nr:tetratricopeptide repeat protein [Leptospira jelokensis]
MKKISIIIISLLFLNCSDKEEALSFYRKGIEFYSKKSLEKAIIEFESAIKADKKFVSARLMKGKSEYYLGKHPEAKITFESINEDFPGNAAALTWLGKIAMLDSSKRNDAKQYLSLAVQLDDNQIDSHYYLGKLFEQEGNVKDALIQYNQAIEISRRVDKVKRDLAEIYRNAGVSMPNESVSSITKTDNKESQKQKNKQK